MYIFSGLRGLSKKCETFTLEGGSSFVVDSTALVVVGCGSPVTVDSAVVVVEVVVVVVTSWPRHRCSLPITINRLFAAKDSIPLRSRSVNFVS